MDFLGVGIHSVGGTVGVGKLYHIVTVTGQSDLGLPLIGSINLCPGHILCNAVYGKYRCGCCGLFLTGRAGCLLQRKVEVCFSNCELDLGLFLSVVNVVVLSDLIVSEGPLVFQAGCDSIGHDHVIQASSSRVTCLINQAHRNFTTGFCRNCKHCFKYRLVSLILNSFFSLSESICVNIAYIGRIRQNIFLIVM